MWSLGSAFCLQQKPGRDLGDLHLWLLSARMNKDNPQQQSGITSPTDLPPGRVITSTVSFQNPIKGKTSLPNSYLQLSFSAESHSLGTTQL